MDVNLIQEMWCVVHIILYEVLPPELLVEGPVFRSADRVSELENKINI
jgi:hypothetical protein